jgi:hypothetical protein
LFRGSVEWLASKSKREAGTVVVRVDGRNLLADNGREDSPCSLAADRLDLLAIPAEERTVLVPWIGRMAC